MRVLLFDTAVDGHHLGYLAALTRYLRAQGDEVIFATWGPDPRLSSLEAGDRPDRIEFVGRGRPPARLRALTAGVTALRRALAIARTERAHVVHLLDLGRFEIPLWLVRLPGRRPQVVGTLVSLVRPVPGERPGLHRRLFHAFRRRALRRILRSGKLQALVVLSDGQRRRIRQTLGEDALTRTALVHTPVLYEAVPRDEARSTLGLPPGVPIVLMLGAMRSDQGPELFLESLRYLPGEWLAVMAGGAARSRRSSLERLRMDLPDPSRVVMRLQWLSEQRDVPRYLAAADVVALPYRPSHDLESGVLNLAAAAERPVVATDVGELGADIRAHGLGGVVEPDSPTTLAAAIRRFLDDPRVPDPEGARRYARRNDWRLVGRLIREIYVAGPS